jgi:hypothetical protein
VIVDHRVRDLPASRLAGDGGDELLALKRQQAGGAGRAHGSHPRDVADQRDLPE